MEWVLGAYYLIARDAASEKHKTEESSFEGESSRARMHRDLQQGCNSGWHVYSGETSRIIKRNAADVLGVTRLDGGKLDLRGWNWLTRAYTVVPFSNGAHMFYKIVPAYINKTGKKASSGDRNGNRSNGSSRKELLDLCIPLYMIMI